MNRIIYMLITLCALLNVSLSKGQSIQFEERLSLAEVRQKAVQENKLVLIDCYATWCLPCRQMDERVHSSPEVVSFVNQNYVSMKIQFDQTSADNDIVIKRYVDAKKLDKEFRIRSFPTYLVLSRNEHFLFRSSGSLPPEDFIKMLQDAKDKEREFLLLSNAYSEHNMDERLLKDLIALSKKVGTPQYQEALNKQYFKNFLSKRSPMKFNQADLETVWPFVNIKNKTLLNFFNDRNRQIDSIAQWRHGSAESIAQYAIIRDVIYPLLWVDTEHHQVRNKIPNWSKIQQKLERDFKRFNIGNIMNDVKVTFYKNQREWDRLLEVKMKMMSASTLDTSNPFSIAAFNNLIYGLILPISNDKAVLETAEKWLSKIIAARPNQAGSIDTYANILYKQGKVAEAIFQQERACKLAPNNEAINENYKKMKAGIPTWDYPVDPNVF